MRRLMSAVIFLPFLLVGLVNCQSGGWRGVSIKLDELEDEIRGHGLITIKRPDVWTENRLHTYRREFENAFSPTGDKPSGPAHINNLAP